MSRPLPRSVYLRRRLLLFAGALLVAWAVVQFWPFGDSGDPVTTTTVSTPAVTSPTADMPSATPIITRTTVKLAGGGKTCDPKTVTLTPSIRDAQHARKPVAIDVAVATSGAKPCILRPKSYDPLAVIERDAKDVWDSSICKKSLLRKSIQLTPDWATTVRVMWTPRKSGKECDDDEDWISPDDYTLRIGMLGGEPASTKFSLSKPLPKPKPSPTASTDKPKAEASAKPSSSAKSSAKQDDR